jgi:fatty acid desaturase
LCLECATRRNLNSTILWYILLPASGLLLLLFSPNSWLGYMFLFIFAGLLVCIPLILLHELSHALVAHALSFRVFAIHLGLGKVLFSRRFLGIAWTVQKCTITARAFF